MANKLLVAYGSKYGATREIAERIGKVLAEAGLAVTVASAADVDSVSAYDAVVLGSGVYAGQWRKEAAALLQGQESALAARPVWLFSSGPTSQGDPATLTSGWLIPDGLKPVAERIKPRDITIFHGALNKSKLNLIEKLMMKMMKAPYGDFRDWAAISAWAQSIAAAVQSA
ncbi:MAG: flavodoxin [Anaerolineales bacterium]|nr:flavodoxin [Anaerolineales bacterium]